MKVKAYRNEHEKKANKPVFEGEIVEFMMTTGDKVVAVVVTKEGEFKVTSLDQLHAEVKVAKAPVSANTARSTSTSAKQK